jgi:AraC-like DNA-binding protein
MNQAKHLLETSFFTVKETARRVGITDASHFIRDFEKQFGLSPERYRRQFHSAVNDRSSTLKLREKIEIAEMASK